MFHILLPVPVLPVVLEGLTGHCRVSKLWELEPSGAARQADWGADVRGLAVGGHFDVDGAFMGRFPHLEIVANFGVGYNNIDTAWAARHGVVVTNTPDVLNEEVADTAMGLVIATTRQLPAAERHVRAGGWRERPFPLTASLRGRTIGILGLGRIGKAIATRAEAFGMAVVYHGRKPQAGVPYLYCPTVLGPGRSLRHPGGDRPRRLGHAPPCRRRRARGSWPRRHPHQRGARLAGGRGRPDRRAAVPPHPGGGPGCLSRTSPHVPQALIDMDHVVLLPHVGSASTHTRIAMGQLVVDNVLSWASGRGPMTPVPETPWPAART